MNSDMKKHHILLIVLVLVVAGLAALAVHKYNTTPKGLTLTQAVHQRDAALTDLKLQKQLTANAQAAEQTLTTSNHQLTVTQDTLCKQIKAAKLAQPLCTQQ